MKDELRHPGCFLGAQTPFGYIHHADDVSVLPGRSCIALDLLPEDVLDRTLRRLAVRMEQEGRAFLPLLSPHRPEQIEGLLLPREELLILGAEQLHDRMSRDCARRIVPEEALIAPPEDPEALRQLFCRQEEALLQAEIFLRIAGTAAELCRSIVRLGIDERKIHRLAEKICRQELPGESQSGHAPRREERFLTSISGDGQHICDCSGWADRLYLLEDAHSAFAPDLLEQVEEAAHSHGYDTVVCRCPLAPFSRIEHLFLPELSLGFVTSNNSHTMPVEPFRVINSRRFTSPQHLRRVKEQLLQNKHIQRQTLLSACRYLHRAEEIMEELQALTAVRSADPDQAAERLADRVWEVMPAPKPERR